MDYPYSTWLWKNTFLLSYEYSGIHSTCQTTGYEWWETCHMHTPTSSMWTGTEQFLAGEIFHFGLHGDGSSWVLTCAACHVRSRLANWNHTLRVHVASTRDCWRTSKLKGSSGRSHRTWSAEAAWVRRWQLRTVVQHSPWQSSCNFKNYQTKTFLFNWENNLLHGCSLRA